MNVLSVNAGSSSLKCALFTSGSRSHPALRARASVTRVGLPGGRLSARLPDGVTIDEPVAAGDHGDAFDAALRALDRFSLPTPDAVGHRIVHGGPSLSTPVRVDDEVVKVLRGLVPFAPLHLPAGLRGVDVVTNRLPGVPQVACFDTAFHRTMPEAAERLALPGRLWDDGVRRYGFHGLSYEHVAATLGPSELDRAVVAHLGNGVSLAALRAGRSVDTTMSFTPAGGVMMGTRSGDLDPGVLVYLVEERGYDGNELRQLVDRESGLFGVSGSTPDMQALLAERAREPDGRAALAVAMFCRQLRMQIGAYAAELGGLTALVFTGGIGEHSADVRAEVCQGLGHLGVTLDLARNGAHSPVISTDGTPCTVRVVPADEELVIARHTQIVVSEG